MTSYLRPIDFMYHSTLGVRVIKKKKDDLTPALIARALDSILSPIDLMANVFGPMNTSLVLVTPGQVSDTC